ncbi:MAG: magnesium/cobalt transporter CorA [cyanobacterium endosymbiont of Rhopalodia musculus]|uniref:magnesium/cobalt transporter CorA n=1 Tax=cyanobacterium endosymbiont of Epithemia clementina EcSB TaxID=3034674 RepID=UPI0024804BBE|nr:magnesium/cobalt transporter CorA [cyanobacterium endosymbiont of Epithemia clementina EcSB]WGT67611.1 magnesium/cobalt transporter CorA [cyanobacterium endosymbiont of Epithemia clementina EcSB]
MTKLHRSDPKLPQKLNLEEEDYFDYFYDEPGSEPGTLNIEPDAKPSRIVLIDYDEINTVCRVDVIPNALIPYLGSNTVSWMDVQGLGSEIILKQVGKIFKLHPLLLEDVVNVPQRPKVEDYNGQLMIIAQMVFSQPSEEGFSSEQVGFILGQGYLLTFQEKQIEDCFNIVRNRIYANQGKVRHTGPDYLTYLLLDSIIDGYFPVLEKYGDRIETLEDQLVVRPQSSYLEEIYAVRRELLALRRAIWPLRNVTDLLVRGESSLIQPEIKIYFRDCYDHVIQLLDIVETYRELASSLMDVYLSSTSNRMNEIMQVLTVISTIFIPLTFIAGVYGMNFKYMPELNWRWSYFTCLGLMATVATSLIFFFWRRGWFDSFYTFKRD